MASKDGSFNVLGSEKLNTADGRNPPKDLSSSPNTSLGDGGAPKVGQSNTDEYKKQCLAAHNALEDKLREKERLARWRRE